MARGDLTDEQWAVLEPLLPKGKKVGRPPIWTRRQLIDGIRFRVRTGVPWRDVPGQYGSWARVYDLFHRWQRDGTWQRISTQLQERAEATDLITWDLDADSADRRAHLRAARARRRGSSGWSRPAVSSPSRTITGSDAGTVRPPGPTACREAGS